MTELKILINSQTVPTLTIIVSLLLLLSFVILLFSEIKRHTEDVTKKCQRIMACVSLVAFTGLCITGYQSINLILLSQTALEHGCDTPYSTIISDMKYGIDNSAREDMLPDDLKDCVIIYYRFGCPDCELIYNSLSARTKNVERVYWVATRSRQGRHLRLTYPVADVPTALYIDKNGVATEYNITVKSKEDGKTVIGLNDAVLSQLLAMPTQSTSA